MDYKKALENFNGTDEYQMQMEFLCSKLKPEPNDIIMDYGAGLGNTIKYIQDKYKVKQIWGFDVQHFCNDAPEWFRDSVPAGWITKLYFMHSIAHIKDKSFLGRLDLAPKAKCVVITPNMDFVRMMNPNYVDPTVHKHYTPNELSEEFELWGWKTTEKGSFGREIKGIKERAYLVAEKIS